MIPTKPQPKKSTKVDAKKSKRVERDDDLETGHKEVRSDEDEF